MIILQNGSLDNTPICSRSQIAWYIGHTGMTGQKTIVDEYTGAADRGKEARSADKSRLQNPQQDITKRKGVGK